MSDKSQTTEPVIPGLFLFGCRAAIATMRGAGLSEVQISFIIQDVRSTTLNEEFRRIVELITAHPPHHHTWVQLMQEVETFNVQA